MDLIGSKCQPRCRLSFCRTLDDRHRILWTRSLVCECPIRPTEMGCCVRSSLTFLPATQLLLFVALLLLVYLKSKHQEADLILECAARIQKSQSRRMDNAAVRPSCVAVAPPKDGVHKYLIYLEHTHVANTSSPSISIKPKKRRRRRRSKN